MILQEARKTVSRVICVGADECVVPFQLPRSSDPSRVSRAQPQRVLSRPRSRAQSLSVYLEYNLQTPLNARSRFKAPGEPSSSPFVPECKDFEACWRESPSRERAHHPLVTPSRPPPLLYVRPPTFPPSTFSSRNFDSRSPVSQGRSLCLSYRRCVPKGPPAIHLARFFRKPAVIKLLNTLCPPPLEESALGA